MATVTCASCTADNDDAEPFCLECGNVLTPAASPPPPTRVIDTPGPAQCPHCGAEVPDPINRACVECLRPFPAAPAEPARPADDPRVTGTRRDGAAGVSLRLSFSAGGTDLGHLDVAADEELLVGREPTSRCAAVVAAWDNVSRRHAVVGFDGDGAAWVRDEYSTNGTSLNDVPVRPGRRSVLQHGDKLAFGADVVARVARESGQ